MTEWKEARAIDQKRQVIVYAIKEEELLSNVEKNLKKKTFSSLQ